MEIYCKEVLPAKMFNYYLNEYFTEKANNILSSDLILYHICH